MFVTRALWKLQIFYFKEISIINQQFSVAENVKIAWEEPLIVWICLLI